MNKKDILKEIFDIENISIKILQCPKITEKQLLDTLSKPSYNLKKELNIAPQTVTRYIAKLFPDRIKSSTKVDNWLLAKYGYKECKHCHLVKELEEFHKSKSRGDGRNGYCSVCQNNLTSETSSKRQAKYRASKLNRTPKWVGFIELEEINEIYKNCPKGMEVDHIIPLQGELVSGLHVKENLQYLTKQKNKEKKNKYSPIV